MFRDKQAYIAQAGGWRPQQTEIQRLLHEATFPQLAVLPQPADLACFEASIWGKHSEQIMPSRTTGCWDESVRNVAKEAIAQGAPDGCKLTLNTVTSKQDMLGALLVMIVGFSAYVYLFGSFTRPHPKTKQMLVLGFEPANASLKAAFEEGYTADQALDENEYNPALIWIARSINATHDSTKNLA
jgi:hypothetical protein